MSPRLELIFSCEHASRRIPPEWRASFRTSHSRLRSHEGYDIGALAVATDLSRRLAAPLLAAPYSRLVADTNRSAHHPRVIGAELRSLPRRVRDDLLARYHRPHRETVAAAVAARLDDATLVLHVAVHTFTPIWEGVVRSTDVGLLYDPQRPRERALVAEWQGILQDLFPGGKIRRNDPYRGRADGLTTTLRTRFPASAYLGVELELNQAWAGNARGRRRQVAAIATSLEALRTR